VIATPRKSVRVAPDASVRYTGRERGEVVMSESHDGSAEGSGQPADELTAALYDRLKQLAHQQLARGARKTLDTTELVHELYLRVIGNDELKFEHPAKFYSYAAQAMRYVLADRARHRMRQKVGGEWIKVTLTANEDLLPAIESAEQALALEEALKQLAEIDARAAQIIELRWFAGVDPEQIAAMLGIARRTVDRDWRFARAFLHSILQ
jgi:RNA polymerase sigma factor (TIGR02999 family)